MATTAYAPPNEALMAMFDLRVEPSVRLEDYAKTLPGVQLPRFRTAIARAGVELERMTPGVMGFTGDAMVAGLYARVRLGNMVVVIASGRRALSFEVPLDGLEGLRGEGHALLEAEGRLAGDIVPIIAKMVLKEGALAPHVLGMLLDGTPLIEPIKVMARLGAAPALLVLLARDGRGSLRLAFPVATPIEAAFPPEGEPDA